MFFDDTKYDKAVEYYEKAIKNDPKRSDYHANLTEVYNKKENRKKAQEEYKEAIEYDRYNGEYHNNLGEVYLSDGNVEEAAKCFFEAMKACQRSEQLYHYISQLISVCEKIKDAGKAISFLKTALKYGKDYKPKLIKAIDKLKARS